MPTWSSRSGYHDKAILSLKHTTPHKFILRRRFADIEMFGYVLLMLGVLLNSAVSQDTSGDQQCGPGQEQCVQNSVERMRYEMDAMQDDLRRLIKESQEITSGLERVTRENHQLSTENVVVRKDLERVKQEANECTSNIRRMTRENQKITADLQEGMFYLLSY